MTFDELKKTWQSQESSFRLTIESNLLLKEIQRNKKSFASTIFWRDVREVGVAVIMFFVFLYLGIKDGLWPLSLLALLCLWVGVFMVVAALAGQR